MSRTDVPSEIQWSSNVLFLFIIEFVPLLALIAQMLTRCGIHWAYISLYLVPLGAITLLVMPAMPSQRFGEKKDREQNK